MNIVLWAVAFLELGLLYLLIRPLARGAIYFRSKSGALETMLRFSGRGTGRKMVDLGSGDGRVLIAFARRGFEAHGYEINPLLVWFSRRAIRRAGLSGKAFVYWKSFWEVNMGDFDIVAVYCIPRCMKKIGLKLRVELKSSAQIFSNLYDVPGWPITLKENHVRVYMKKSGSGPSQGPTL